MERAACLLCRREDIWIKRPANFEAGSILGEYF